MKQFSQIQKALNMSIVKTFRIVDTTSIILGPELQSFPSVKGTLTLREVIMRHDNKHLLIMFRSDFAFNRLRTPTTGSPTYFL